MLLVMLHLDSRPADLKFLISTQFMGKLFFAFFYFRSHHMKKERKTSVKGKLTG